MDALQDLIGYRFENTALLEEALTHASVSYERQARQADNQRLEFLGDAVIQLTLSQILFAKLPSADEGILTKARAQMVSTKGLATLSAELGIGDFLTMGRGEEANGGRTRESTLADALEAIAGAVFLDGGIDAAIALTRRLFHRGIESLQQGELVESNPKGQLQEWIQAVDASPPEYSIVNESGQDHDKRFVAEVRWGGDQIGRGEGRSKKEAETAAAADALEKPDLLKRMAELRRSS